LSCRPGKLIAQDRPIFEIVGAEFLEVLHSAVQIMDFSALSIMLNQKKEYICRQGHGMVGD
jgi:hypothetical protein